VYVIATGEDYVNIRRYNFKYFTFRSRRANRALFRRQRVLIRRLRSVQSKYSRADDSPAAAEYATRRPFSRASVPNKRQKRIRFVRAFAIGKTQYTNSPVTTSVQRVRRATSVSTFAPYSRLLLLTVLPSLPVKPDRRYTVAGVCTPVPLVFPLL